MTRSHKLSVRALSLLLAFTFLVSDLALAAPMDVVVQPSALEALAQDPTRFEAPAEFAALKEIHRGPGGTFIIHIQDAHSNLSGQQSLAGALDDIMRRYQVSLVLAEGGSRDDTLTPIKSVASPKVWQRVAKSFLIEGKISGDEYLNLISDHPMKIMGIEDDELYLKSVREYGRLAEKREDILDYLKKIQSAVSKLKARAYPKRLLDYEARKEPARAAGEIDYKSLIVLARSAGADFGKLPNLARLMALDEKEKGIDFEAANLEHAALLEAIVGAGGKAELAAGLGSSALRERKVSQYTYFQNTFHIAKTKRIDLSAYPHLAIYAGYLKDFSEIDLDAALGEIVQGEDEAYQLLLPKDDQKILRAIDRYVKLLFTAYNIQMSTRDFGLFRANEKDFATARELAFLNRRLAEAGCVEDLLPYRDTLEKGQEALESFYETVDQRDFAFLRNAERILKEENQKVAVLISGGYHTPHLKTLFREKGFSYAVLTPVVTSQTNQAKYERLLLAPVRKALQTRRAPAAEDEKPLSALEEDLLSARDKSDGVSVQKTGEPQSGARLAELVAAAASLETGDPGAAEERAAKATLGFYARGRAAVEAQAPAVQIDPGARLAAGPGLSLSFEKAEDSDLEDILKMQTESPASKNIWLTAEEIRQLVAAGQVYIDRTTVEGRSVPAGVVFTALANDPDQYAYLKDPKNSDADAPYMFDFWILVNQALKGKPGFDSREVLEHMIRQTALSAAVRGKSVIAFSRAGGASKYIGTMDISTDALKAKRLLNYILATRPPKGQPGIVSTDHFFEWLEERYPGALTHKFEEIRSPTAGDIWNPASDRSFTLLTGLLFKKFVDETGFIPEDFTVGVMHMGFGAYLSEVKLNSRPEDKEALESNVLMSYKPVKEIDVTIRELIENGVLSLAAPGARLAAQDEHDRQMAAAVLPILKLLEGTRTIQSEFFRTAEEMRLFISAWDLLRSDAEGDLERAAENEAVGTRALASFVISFIRAHFPEHPEWNEDLYNALDALSGHRVSDEDALNRADWIDLQKRRLASGQKGVIYTSENFKSDEAREDLYESLADEHRLRAPGNPRAYQSAILHAVIFKMVPAYLLSQVQSEDPGLRGARLAEIFSNDGRTMNVRLFQALLNEAADRIRADTGRPIRIAATGSAWDYADADGTLSLSWVTDLDIFAVNLPDAEGRIMSVAPERINAELESVLKGLKIEMYPSPEGPDEVTYEYRLPIKGGKDLPVHVLFARSSVGVHNFLAVYELIGYDIFLRRSAEGSPKLTPHETVRRYVQMETSFSSVLPADADGLARRIGERLRQADAAERERIEPGLAEEIKAHPRMSVLRDRFAWLLGVRQSLQRFESAGDRDTFDSIAARAGGDVEFLRRRRAEKENLWGVGRPQTEAAVEALGSRPGLFGRAGAGARLAGVTAPIEDWIGDAPVLQAWTMTTFEGVMTPSRFDEVRPVLTAEAPEILAIGPSVSDVRFLAERYPQGRIHIVDLNLEILEKRKQVLDADAALAARVRYSRADASKLSSYTGKDGRPAFPDGSVDLLYAVGVNVSAFRDEALGRVQLAAMAEEEVRLLRPGGVLYHPQDARNYDRATQDGRIERIDPVIPYFYRKLRSASPVAGIGARLPVFLNHPILFLASTLGRFVLDWSLLANLLPAIAVRFLEAAPLRLAALRQAEDALHFSAVPYDMIHRHFPTIEPADFGSEPASISPRQGDFRKPRVAEDGTILVSEQTAVFVPAEQFPAGRTILTSHVKSCSAAIAVLTTQDGRTIYMLSHQYRYAFDRVTSLPIAELFRTQAIRKAEIFTRAYEDAQSVRESVDRLRAEALQANPAFEVVHIEGRHRFGVAVTVTAGADAVRAHEWNWRGVFPMDHHIVDFSGARANLLFERAVQGARLAQGTVPSLDEALEIVKPILTATENHLPHLARDLALATEWVAQIDRLDGVQTVAMAGSGLRFLPVLLALTGRQMLFVEPNPSQAGIVRDLVGVAGQIAEARGFKAPAPMKIVQAEIGALDTAANGVAEGTFDLVMFPDLVGGKPVGDPAEWLKTAKKLLRGKGYLAIDEESEGELSLARSIAGIFPYRGLVSEEYLTALYNWSGGQRSRYLAPAATNRIYRVFRGENPGMRPFRAPTSEEVLGLLAAAGDALERARTRVPETDHDIQRRIITAVAASGPMKGAHKFTELEKEMRGQWQAYSNSLLAMGPATAQSRTHELEASLSLLSLNPADAERLAKTELRFTQAELYANNFMNFLSQFNDGRPGSPVVDTALLEAVRADAQQARDAISAARALIYGTDSRPLNPVLGARLAESWQTLDNRKVFGGEEPEFALTVPQKLVDRLRQERREGDPLPVVLDLGAGVGNVSLWLHGQGFHVLGLERDSARVAQASDRMPLTRKISPDAAPRQWIEEVRRSTQPSIAFRTADLSYGVPVPDGSVDAVVLHRALSAITEPAQRAALVAEIARVLRPGGYVSFLDYRRRVAGDADFGEYQTRYAKAAQFLQQTITANIVPSSWSVYMQDPDMRPLLVLRSREGRTVDETILPAGHIVRGIEKGALSLIFFGIHATPQSVEKLFSAAGVPALEFQEVGIPYGAGKTSLLGGFLARKQDAPGQGARLAAGGERVTLNGQEFMMFPGEEVGRKMIELWADPNGKAMGLRPDLMAYAVRLGPGSEEYGLRGVYIKGSLRGDRLFRPLLGLYFKNYPEVNATAADTHNLVLLDVLARDYGFEPPAGSEPNVYLKDGVFHLDPAASAEFRKAAQSIRDFIRVQAADDLSAFRGDIAARPLHLGQVYRRRGARLAIPTTPEFLAGYLGGRKDLVAVEIGAGASPFLHTVVRDSRASGLLDFAEVYTLNPTSLERFGAELGEDGKYPRTKLDIPAARVYDPDNPLPAVALSHDPSVAARVDLIFANAPLLKSSPGRMFAEEIASMASQGGLVFVRLHSDDIFVPRLMNFLKDLEERGFRLEEFRTELPSGYPPTDYTAGTGVPLIVLKREKEDPERESRVIADLIAALDFPNYFVMLTAAAALGHYGPSRAASAADPIDRQSRFYAGLYRDDVRRRLEGIAAYLRGPAGQGARLAAADRAESPREDEEVGLSADWEAQLRQVISTLKEAFLKDPNDRVNIWAVDSYRNLNKALEEIKIGNLKKGHWWYAIELWETGETLKTREGMRELHRVLKEGYDRVFVKKENQVSLGARLAGKVLYSQFALPEGMTKLNDRLSVSETREIAPGIEVRAIGVEDASARARGEAAFIDLVAYDLVQRYDPRVFAKDISFPITDHDPVAGYTVQEWVAREADPSRVVAAFNKSQGHGWEPNTLTVLDGRLLMRDAGKRGVNQPVYEVPQGDYWVLSFDRDKRGVFPVTIGSDGQPVGGLPVRNGFAGPLLLKDGQSRVSEIRFGAKPAFGNAVGWPASQPASLSAYGYDGQGRLVIVQLSGNPDDPEKGETTIEHLVEALLALGVRDAVLGGGSGDVQRYYKGETPEVARAQGRKGSLFHRVAEILEEGEVPGEGQRRVGEALLVVPRKDKDAGARLASAEERLLSLASWINAGNGSVEWSQDKYGQTAKAGPFEARLEADPDLVHVLGGVPALRIYVRPVGVWTSRFAHALRYLTQPRKTPRLDMPSRLLPPPGSLGQLVLMADEVSLSETGPPVRSIEIREVQQRLGYRNLPQRLRWQLDPWRDGAIAKIAAYVASSPGTILYANNKPRSVFFYDKAEMKRSYVEPYERLGWRFEETLYRAGKAIQVTYAPANDAVAVSGARPTIPEFAVLKPAQWKSDEEIQAEIAESVAAGKGGITVVTPYDTSANFIDTVVGALAGTAAAKPGTYSFDGKLAGAKVLIIGPGRSGEEIFRFIRNYPGIAEIHVVDPTVGVFEALDKRLAAAGHVGLPVVYAHRTDASGITADLNGQVDLVFDSNVFDSAFFHPIHLRRIADRIPTLLKVKGVHMSVGFRRLRQYMYSDPVVPDPLSDTFQEVWVKREGSGARLALEPAKIVIESVGSSAYGQVRRVLASTNAVTDTLARLKLAGVPQEDADRVIQEVRLTRLDARQKDAFTVRVRFKDSRPDALFVLYARKPDRRPIGEEANLHFASAASDRVIRYGGTYTDGTGLVVTAEHVAGPDLARASRQRPSDAPALQRSAARALFSLWAGSDGTAFLSDVSLAQFVRVGASLDVKIVDTGLLRTALPPQPRLEEADAFMDLAFLFDRSPRSAWVWQRTGDYTGLFDGLMDAFVDEDGARIGTAKARAYLERTREGVRRRLATLSAQNGWSFSNWRASWRQRARLRAIDREIGRYLDRENPGGWLFRTLAVWSAVGLTLLAAYRLGVQNPKTSPAPEHATPVPTVPTLAPPPAVTPSPATLSPMSTEAGFSARLLAIRAELITDAGLRRELTRLQDTVRHLVRSESALAAGLPGDAEREVSLRALLVSARAIERVENPARVSVQMLSGGRKGPAFGAYQMEGRTAVYLLKHLIRFAKSEPGRTFLEPYRAELSSALGAVDGEADLERRIRALNPNAPRDNDRVRDGFAERPSLHFLTMRYYLYRTLPSPMRDAEAEFTEFYLRSYNTSYFRGGRGLSSPSKIKAALRFEQWLADRLSQPDVLESQEIIALELQSRLVDLSAFSRVQEDLTRAARHTRDVEASKAPDAHRAALRDVYLRRAADGEAALPRLLRGPAGERSTLEADLRADIDWLFMKAGRPRGARLASELDVTPQVEVRIPAVRREDFEFVREVDPTLSFTGRIVAGSQGRVYVVLTADGRAAGLKVPQEGKDITRELSGPAPADRANSRHVARALGAYRYQNGEYRPFTEEEFRRPDPPHVSALLVEWVNGQPVEDAVSEGRLTPGEMVLLANALMDDLARPESNLYYTDIKPENVLLRAREGVDASAPVTERFEIVIVDRGGFNPIPRGLDRDMVVGKQKKDFVRNILEMVSLAAEPVSGPASQSGARLALPAETGWKLVPKSVRLSDFIGDTPAADVQMILVSDNSGTLVPNFETPLEGGILDALKTFAASENHTVVFDTGDPFSAVFERAHRPFLEALALRELPAREPGAVPAEGTAAPSGPLARVHYVADSGNFRTGLDAAGKMRYSQTLDAWPVEDRFSYARTIAELFFAQLKKRQGPLAALLEGFSDAAIDSARDVALAKLDRIGQDGSWGRSDDGSVYKFYLLTGELGEKLGDINIYDRGAKVTIEVPRRTQAVPLEFTADLLEGFTAKYGAARPGFYTVAGNGYLDVTRTSKVEGVDRTLEEEVFPGLDPKKKILILVMGDSDNDIPTFGLKTPAGMDVTVLRVYLSRDARYAGKLPEDTLVARPYLEGAKEALDFVNGTASQMEALVWERGARLAEEKTVDQAVRSMWTDFWGARVKLEGQYEGAFDSYPPFVFNYVAVAIRGEFGDAAGKRFLDIGAGADLWVSRNLATGFPGAEINALDLVDVDPTRIPGAERVLYRKTDAEATGFADGELDLVFSTFGVDYADRDRVTREMFRVLKTGGRAVLVLHAPGSPFYEDIAKQLERSHATEVFYSRLKAALEADDFVRVNALLSERGYILPSVGPAQKEGTLGQVNPFLESARAKVATFERVLANSFETLGAARRYYFSQGFRVVSSGPVDYPDEKVRAAWGLVLEKAPRQGAPSAIEDSKLLLPKLKALASGPDASAAAEAALWLTGALAGKGDADTRTFASELKVYNDTVLLPRGYLLERGSGYPDEGRDTLNFYKVLSEETRTVESGPVRVLSVRALTTEDDGGWPTTMGWNAFDNDYSVVLPENAERFVDRRLLALVNGTAPDFTPHRRLTATQPGAEAARIGLGVRRTLIAEAFRGVSRDALVREIQEKAIRHEIEHENRRRLAAPVLGGRPLDLDVEEEIAYLSNLRDAGLNIRYTFSNTISNAVRWDEPYDWYILAAMTGWPRLMLKTRFSAVEKLKIMQAVALLAARSDDDIRADAEAAYARTDDAWRQFYGIAGARLSAKKSSGVLEEARRFDGDKLSALASGPDSGIAAEISAWLKLQTADKDETFKYSFIDTLQKYSNDVLVPRGYILELNPDYATSGREPLDLFRIEGEETRATRTGPVRVLFVRSLTADTHVSQTLMGWSALHNDYVAVIPPNIARLVDDRIVPLLEGTPVAIEPASTLTQSEFGRQAAAIGQSVRPRILKAAFPRPVAAEIGSFFRELAIRHELEHEIRRRLLKNADNRRLPDQDVDEEVAELTTMRDPELSARYVLFNLVSAAVRYDSSHYWFILARLNGVEGLERKTHLSPEEKLFVMKGVAERLAGLDEPALRALAERAYGEAEKAWERYYGMEGESGARLAVFVTPGTEPILASELSSPRVVFGPYQERYPANWQEGLPKTVHALGLPREYRYTAWEMIYNALAHSVTAENRTPSATVSYTLYDRAGSTRPVLELSILQAKVSDTDWDTIRRGAEKLAELGISYLLNTQARRQESPIIGGLGFMNLGNLMQILPVTVRYERGSDGSMRTTVYFEVPEAGARLARKSPEQIVAAFEGLSDSDQAEFIARLTQNIYAEFVTDVDGDFADRLRAAGLIEYQTVTADVLSALYGRFPDYRREEEEILQESGGNALAGARLAQTIDLAATIRAQVDELNRAEGVAVEFQDETSGLATAALTQEMGKPYRHEVERALSGVLHRFLLDRNVHAKVSIVREPEGLVVDFRSGSSEAYHDLLEAEKGVLYRAGSFSEFARFYGWGPWRTHFRIVFPDARPLVVRGWQSQDEIDALGKKYTTEEGRDAQTMAHEMYTYDFEALRKKWSPSLDGEDALVIGPYRNARDILALLAAYPKLKALHLAEIDVDSFYALHKQLLASGVKLPEIYAYRQSVLELPAELTGRLGLVFDKYVFAEGWFSEGHLRRGGEEIRRVLRPGGAHVTAGNAHQFPGHPEASGMTTLDKNPQETIFIKAGAMQVIEIDPSTPNGGPQISMAGARLAAEPAAETPYRFLGELSLPEMADWESLEKTFGNDPQLKEIFLRAILARVIDREPISIQTQDRAGFFLREGQSIVLLDKDTREPVLQDGEPVRFTPTAEELAAAKETLRVAPPVTEALRAKTEAVVLETDTLSDFLREREQEASPVQDALEGYLALNPATPLLSIAKNLDALPDDAERPETFDVYVANYLVTLLELSRTSAAKNVVYRLTGSEERVARAMKTELAQRLLRDGILRVDRPLDPETGAAARELDLTPAAGVRSGTPYLPETEILAGEVANFKATVLLSIFAGRINADAPPESFLNAYRTALGPKVSAGLDARVVTRFLKGDATQGALSLALQFALRPIRAIEWSKLIQFYQNVQRMVSQAA